MKRGQRRGALGRLRGGVRRTTPERRGQRRLEKEDWKAGQEVRRGVGGGGGRPRKADPSLGRNLHPHHLVPPTVVPHAGNKVVPETRVWWEQTGSRMRHPRPWRPNFRNQVAGKNTFIFAHQQPCLGEVEPDPRAPAGKRENPQFSGRRRTQAALAAAREPGSRRGVGRDLAARSH